MVAHEIYEPRSHSRLVTKTRNKSRFISGYKSSSQSLRKQEPVSLIFLMGMSGKDKWNKVYIQSFHGYSTAALLDEKTA